MARVLALLMGLAALSFGATSARAALPPVHYRFDIEWGEYGIGNGQLYSPMRLNIKGNYLLEGDRDNHRLQMFTLDGTFVRKYGSYGTGVDNLSSAVDADFDAANRIYVMDWGNGRVVVRDFNFNYLRQFGSEGRGDEQTMGPRGLAVDRQNNWVYVADTLNSRICKWTTGGKHLFNFGEAGIGPGQLNQPYDVAVGPAGVYVADTENDRIVQFSSAGLFIRMWDGSQGGGKLAWPPGVAVAPGGTIFVADGDNNRIVRYTGSGQFISAFARFGSGPGEFDMPAGVAIDSQMRVYVSDAHQHRLERFRPNLRPTNPTSVWITPARPADDSSLGAHATGCADGDGDILSYCYRWYESPDNVTWTCLRSTRMMPAASTRAGRWYRFTTRVWDGYDYSGWTTSRAVRVLPQPSLATLGVTARQVPSGSIAVTVTLAAPAQVQSELTNLAGRTVAAAPLGDLAAGTTSLAMPSISTHGTRLPPGQYLLKLTAREPGGCRLSQLTPLALR